MHRRASDRHAPGGGGALDEAMMPERPLSVLILVRDFYPSIEIGARRVTALARHLRSNGLHVVVVSEFGGAPIAAGSEVLPGIVAMPVPAPPRLLLDLLVRLKRLGRSAAAAGPASSAAPATDHASTGSRSLLVRLRDATVGVIGFQDFHKRWSWRASRAGVRAGREYGADIVISSAPSFSPLMGARFVAWRLGVPCIADLRDPWSDINPSARRLNPRARPPRLKRLFERLTLGSSSAITCTVEPYRQILLTRYPRRRVLLIRNGFDGEIQPPRAETGGRLEMLFAGETYMERDPFPLLNGLERLMSRPDVDRSRVRLTMAGRCDSYRGRSLSDWARGKHADRAVRILGQQTPAEVAQLIQQSTVLVNLAQRQELAIPAKTYEHLASGREMLLLSEADSGTSKLVSGISGVHVVDADDGAGLDAVLLDLYRRHVPLGRLTAPGADEVRPYARTAANEQFLSLIVSLTSASRVGQSADRTWELHQQEAPKP